MLKINFNYFRDILQYIKDKVHNDEGLTMKEMYLHFVEGNLIPNCDYYYTIKKLVEYQYVVYGYEFESDGRMFINFDSLTQDGYDFLRIAESRIWEKIDGGFNRFSGYSVDYLKKLIPIFWEAVDAGVTV